MVISQANFTKKNLKFFYSTTLSRELRGEVSKGFQLKISTHPKQKTENGVSILVGGFNPVEKYQSNWIISPGRGENQKYLKPPPRIVHGHQPKKQMLSFLKSMFFWLPPTPPKFKVAPEKGLFSIGNTSEATIDFQGTYVSFPGVDDI